MSTGSQTNLWGGYLITTQRTTERASKGYQALAVTGDATISWSNYSASNDGAVAFLKLTGSLSSSATLTFPAYQNFLSVWNNAGQTVTIKCSGGTGVAIPTGRKALIFCDAVDYYFAGPNYIGDNITEANDRDIADRNYVDTAIATASLPATAGTVLVSGADTTAGYVGAKVNVTGSGAITITASITNPAGNEVKTFAASVDSHALTAGGTKTAAFSAAINTKYNCAFTASGTITFPSSATVGDIIETALAGNYIYTFAPNGLKINGSTGNFLVPGNQTITWTYVSTTDGWV